MTDTASAPSEREKRLAAHRERIAALIPRMPRVRVNPANDDIRKTLVHMPSRIAFPEHGSVEWPADRFTQRRLRDGDITLAEQHEPEPHHRSRRQSAD